MNRFKDCWHLLNLPCEGMSRLASESLDHELTRPERAALRMHTIYCSACRRYLRQLKLIKRALRGLTARLETSEPLPGPGLPDGVRKDKACTQRELETHASVFSSVVVRNRLRRTTHVGSSDISAVAPLHVPHRARQGLRPHRLARSSSGRVRD